MTKTIIRIISVILLFTLIFSAGCDGGNAVQTGKNAPSFSELSVVKEMPIEYATQFSATEYSGGYYLIGINEVGRFLVVPEGKSVPKDLDDDVTVLRQPLDRIYLAATSAMDFFRALDGIGNVRLSGTKKEGWYIDEAKQAMDKGTMLFAGKYSAPDYELIYSQKCNLAIESTMITHSPKVKEQLEGLGVPVLVERSSYETDPFGRMEWIKLYGILLGKADEAQQLFDDEVKRAEPYLNMEKTGKSVAFFYITNTNTVNVRKSGDYFAKMIEMAGGRYIFDNLDSGSQLSTVNMTVEAFYDGAKDADVIIYNSTIDGELYTISELTDKCAMLSNFKAIKQSEAWCIGKNLFQEPMALSRLTVEIHNVLTGNDDFDYVDLHRLRSE